MKLPDGGDWMSNIKFLKPTGKKEKGKNQYYKIYRTKRKGGKKEKLFW